MPGENAAQGVATTANPAPRSCLLIAGDSATLLQGRRCCNLLTPPQFPNLVRLKSHLLTPGQLGG